MILKTLEIKTKLETFTMGYILLSKQNYKKKNWKLHVYTTFLVSNVHNEYA